MRDSLKEGDKLAGVDKNKLIESANKFIAKNQFDKAIKDLQKVLEIDPKNNQVALKIAELFLKLDKKDDATNYYEIASNIFRDSGFYDKAIAVYRQLLTINPVSSQAYMKLAELFRKKNLIAEAVSNYKVAIAIYEREGRTQEALKILQTITELEPSNLPGRMKLAELYIKNGLKDQAYTELSKIAEKLIEAKKTVDLITVYERMLSLKSGDVGIVKLLIRLYLVRGDYQKVLLKVKDVIALGKSDTEVLIALAKAYVALEKIPLAISAYKEVAKLFSKEGLAPQAQEIYKKILELDPTDAQALQIIVGASSEPAVMKEVVPEPFEITRNQAEEEPPVRKVPPAPEKPAAKPQPVKTVQPAVSRERPAEKVQPKPAVKTPERVAELKPPQAAAPRPETGGKAALTQDEIEKFFSEAQVYKRYGLHSKAIEKLNQILNTAPDHRKALEELFELYQLGKKYQEGSQLAEKLYTILMAEGESEKAQTIVQQAVAHDPDNDVLRALVGYTPAEEQEEVPQRRKESPPQEKKREQRVIAEPQPEIEQPSREIPPDIDREIEPIQRPEPAVSVKKESRPQEIETDIEIEVESPVASTEESVPEQAIEEQESIPSEETPAVGNEESGAVQEEAPVEPAAEIPEEPKEEIPEEPREDVPIPEQIDIGPELDKFQESIPGAGAQQSQDEDINFTFSDEELEGIAPEKDQEPVSRRTSQQAAAGEEPKPSIDIIDALDEAEFYYQQGILSEAKGIIQKILSVAPNEEKAKKRLADILAKEQEAHPPVQEKTADLDEPFIEREADHIIAVSADEGLFDLAQELEKELSSGTAAKMQVQQPVEEEQQVSVEEVLEAFKKGVEQSVDKQDAETHYNLGIAYKEMGLIDEAINEFNTSSLSPDKKPDSLIMLGMSYMGKGLPGKAIEMYKQALNAKGGVQEENIGLLYELAVAFEAYGDMKNAYKNFAEVQRIDEKFRDVRSRTAKLAEFVQDAQESEQQEDIPPEAGKFTLDSLLNEDNEEEPAAQPAAHRTPAQKPQQAVGQEKPSPVAPVIQQTDIHAGDKKAAEEEADPAQSKSKPAKKKVSYI